MEDRPFHVVGDIRLCIERAAVREVSPTLFGKIGIPTSSCSCFRRFTRFPNTH